ncbi:MAG: TetR/AcrR family transcriptional regulator [Opitutaceae bacterium]|nr:TetR/AcrR family transcriptional regulator [Opitutaceae bacterium]
MGSSTKTTRLAAAPAPAATESPAGAGVEARARILAAARRHFFALGFASCTMDCLAGELGMSKKTLYRHYRSKEQIIDELLHAKMMAVRDGFEAALAGADMTFAERASSMMRHALAQFSEVSAIFLHDLRRFHPAAYARLEAYRAQIAPGIWERLLRQGMEARAVRADVDPAFVGRLIPVAMQSLLHPDTLERLALQPHEMIDRFFRLIFCGVLTPEGIADYAQHATTRV